MLVLHILQEIIYRDTDISIYAENIIFVVTPPPPSRLMLYRKVFYFAKKTKQNMTQIT